MKTRSTHLLSCIIASMMIMAPCTVYSANLNIGGTVWFAWWKFGMENSIRAKFMPHMSPYNRYRMNPTFLYGPTVSLDFAEKFSISAMFIYTDSYRIYARTVSTLSPTEFERTRHNVTRYDLDATFSYSPVGFFKLFTGFKFQGYDLEGRTFEGDMDGTGFRKNRITGRDMALGAGLGIGFTVPVAGGLYFIWNISGLYLNMRFHYYTDFFKLETAPSVMYIPGEVDMKFRYHSYGGNTNVSLAYVISAISSTIILGFRYQVLYNTLYDLDLEEHILVSMPVTTAYLSYAKDRFIQHRGNGRIYDHFYGISFAFVYSVELTKKTEEGTE
jgi:hypothetical protein